MSKNQENVMNKSQEELNELLKEVIAQTLALDIPISSQIQADVIVNKRAKSRFGCCKKIPPSSLRSEYRDDYKNHNEACYILEISSALVEAPIESIKEVLVHELLHTTPGGGNHTGIWKKYAKLMNENYGYHIQRTNSAESLGVNIEREKTKVKYLIICKKCGIVQERSRTSKVIKHPSLYRCKCGGRLKVHTQ